MSLIQQVLCENVDKLKEFRFIVVQHLMSDTYNFLLELISNGIEINHLFVKEYSCDEAYFSKLQNKIPVKIITGDMSRCYGEVLEEAISKSKADNKKIAILDLGGEFSPVVANIKTEEVQIVVVEDTAFGHRKYEKLVIKNKCVQIYSVAESKFKEIEAGFVGKSIASSAESVLKGLGQTLSGEKVLVIGYGMIGKNVAKALDKMRCKVSVYDKDAVKMCGAYFDGYNVGELHGLLKENTIIFGVTGNTSVNDEDIKYLSDKTVLISGSSNRIEFSKELTDNITPVGEYVDKCTTKGKEIFLLNKGYPINFISKSVPDYVIELLFAEMLLCLAEAARGGNKAGEGIRRLQTDGLNIISRQFLNI